MSLQALTYLVVGASFALYIGIAIWSRAHTTGDFYIAGKSVSPVANGMATAADWMSAASFISMAGLIAFARDVEIPGFWFAQQGSIYIFVLLIFFYAWRMNKIDRKYDVHED